jgi:hypothetical protein
MRQAAGLAPLSPSESSIAYCATSAHLGVGCGGVSSSGGDAPPPIPLPPAPVARRDLTTRSPLPPSAPSPLPPSASDMLLRQAPRTAKTRLCSDSAWHVLDAAENERKGTSPAPLACTLPASCSITHTPLRVSLDLHESRLASSPSPAGAPLTVPLAAVPQAPLSRPKVFFLVLCCTPRVISSSSASRRGAPLPPPKVSFSFFGGSRLLLAVWCPYWR